MTRALTTRAAAILLAGGLAIGACGDGDNLSEEERTEQFCEAAGSVSELEAALAPPEGALSVPAAKEQALAFLDRLERMLDAAPADIEDVADEIRPEIEPLREGVTSATTMLELGNAFTESASGTATDQDLIAPIYLFAVENCPA